MPGVERDDQSVLRVSRSFGMHTPTPRMRISPRNSLGTFQGRWPMACESRTSSLRAFSVKNTERLVTGLQELQAFVCICSTEAAQTLPNTPNSLSLEA